MRYCDICKKPIKGEMFQYPDKMVMCSMPCIRQRVRILTQIDQELSRIHFESKIR